MPDLPLDRDKASRAVRIFNKLRLPDVGGQPSLAEAGGDWQRDIVAALFGSLMPNGRRMVKKPFVLVPKKNSKTTTAAAIMLTAMLLDDDPRQEFLIFAPSHAIAELGFNAARGMIEADPVLTARFHVREHLKRIDDRTTKSSLRIKTFDSSVATGVKPKGILIDEIHELGKLHYAERVMAQLAGGLVSRPDGFMVIITTQSDQPPAGIFKQELMLARAIRDGLAPADSSLATLPVLYEFPEEVQTGKDEPWRDPALWPMVLPNLGRSCHIDLLRADCAEAAQKGESAFRIWASQHLNIEIGLGLHAQRWRGADYWLASAEEDLTLDELLARSEVVTVGVDGGGLDDLFGLSVCGRERDGDRWFTWSHAWAVRSVLKLRKDIASRLAEFEAAGDLTLVDTAHEIVTQVAKLLVRVRESGLLPEVGAIGLDPADVGALVDALEAEGFDAGDAATGRRGQLEAIPQGFGLLSAIHTAEFKLHDGMLRHDGSEMMAWCVGNAKAVQKGNAVVINKEVAGSAKIDPLIAMFCAIKLMERGPVPAAPVRELQVFF